MGEKAWDEPLTKGVRTGKGLRRGNSRCDLPTRRTGRAFTASTWRKGPRRADVVPDAGRTLEPPSRKNAWRDRFAAVPFEDRGGYFEGRYYQEIAIQRVLEALSPRAVRILLTLATGTGKTFIAFQIAWKLFHARWNLSRSEPHRRPRILFLADRNILADQAYNAFSAFPEDALVRIAPADIRKKGKVPKNGSVFFTIFQTFMSGPPDGKPSYTLARTLPISSASS